MRCWEESRNTSHQALEGDYCKSGSTDGTWWGSPYISADNLALLIAGSFPLAWFSLFWDQNFTVSCLIKRNTMSVVTEEVCEGGGNVFGVFSMPEFARAKAQPWRRPFCRATRFRFSQQAALRFQRSPSWQLLLSSQLLQPFWSRSPQTRQVA